MTTPLLLHNARGGQVSTDVACQAGMTRCSKQFGLETLCSRERTGGLVLDTLSKKQKKKKSKPQQQHMHRYDSHPILPYKRTTYHEFFEVWGAQVNLIFSHGCLPYTFKTRVYIVIPKRRNALLFYVP